VVEAATAEYLDGEDALGLWAGECCRVKPGFYDTTANLFASWKAWAEQAGEVVGSQKRFTQALQGRGYAPRRQGGTGKTGFDGIAVKAPISTRHEAGGREADECEGL
jgi:putative DNA primase/helicase